VLDLARTIAELTGKRLDVHHEPSRGGDIRHSVGSPVLSRTALSLPDPVTLRAGLGKVLDWLGGSR